MSNETNAEHKPNGGTADSDALKQHKTSRYLPGPGIINRYWVRGTLTTRTPLHLGTGEMGPSWKNPQRRKEEIQRRKAALAAEGRHEEAKRADLGNFCNYVLLEQQGVDGGAPRDEDGSPRARPVIPGTSLRGVLRSWLEGFLAPFNAPGHYNITGLSATAYDTEQGVTDDDLDQVAQAVRGQPDFGQLSRREQQRAVRRVVERHLREEADLVSFLFGCTRLRSRVAIASASGAESYKDVKKVKKLYEVRSGVSIDRDTGAAAAHKVFDVELVGSGVTFTVDLRLSNVRYWELGMVLAALEVFNHPLFPIQLGGGTQHGYGQMGWKLKELYQLGSDEAGPPSLDDWLAGTDPAGDPAEHLSIPRRRPEGTTSVEAFAKHCQEAFKEVMSHVRS